MENSLRNRIDNNTNLTATEAISFIELLTSSKRILKSNRDKVAWVINNVSLDKWQGHGVYRNVYWDYKYQDGKASYCAGQDYPREIIYLRKLVIDLHHQYWGII